jgi:hypothetical protein
MSFQLAGALHDCFARCSPPAQFSGRVTVYIGVPLRTVLRKTRPELVGKSLQCRAEKDAVVNVLKEGARLCEVLRVRLKLVWKCQR